VTAACPTFGFLAEFDVTDRIGDSDSQKLRHDLERVVASRGLVCGGTRTGPTWSCVIQGEAAQATDADRSALQQWASSRPEISDARIGPLFDLESAT
jgi:uncharacterized protein YggL (DUF469 family)